MSSTERDFRAVLGGMGLVEHTAFNGRPSDHDRQLARHAADIRQKLSSALQLVDDIAVQPQARAANRPITEQYVRAVLKLRRSRDRFFEAELFADPAWDILLELYAAELGQRRMSVSSLCLGAAVPATTALRWIRTLEEKGIIRRAADPMDGRRVFLSLSDEAIIAVGNFFRSVPAGAVLA
jgi:DNA-binding MarR family transcriptional regulator